MSQEIDEKVVEMRFDNKQFEREAATTITTLQKLKKNLDFSKVGDSFSAIEKSLKKVDISGLGNAVESVRSKFSALEIMAITTLGNITNSAVNAGRRWLSAFTIDPIKTGFKEYETQINAVQTILANTQKEGTNIKDVNKALDELNTYADKTIYNFTEMTRNIGTFTAAGIKLDTSVNAIQGIANLAAVSGSNAQQASTAMYQLSQALASGTVKLMDWNSVVNAGMGGQVFQDALRETSELLGTGAERAIKASGSFRESLKDGWLTSEVLTETLKKFTTSGAVEYLAQYTGLTNDVIKSEWESAKAMYGEADAIDKAAEALAKKSGKNKDEIAETMKFAQTAEDAATKVKTFSQLIDTLKEAVQSGWSQSFRTIIGDFEESKELFTEISNSFGEVIKKSADARNKLLGEVFNKTDAQSYISNIVGVSKEAVNELQVIGKEAGTTSDVFKETLNEITSGDKNWKSINNLVTNFVEMANSEKDLVTYMADMTGERKISIIQLQNLGKTFGYTSDKFKNFASELAKGDPEMQATITHLLEMNEAMQKPSGRELLIDSLRNGMKGLDSVIEPVQEAFGEVFSINSDQVYGTLEAFHEFTKTLTLSEKSSENVKKAFKGVFDVVKLLGDGFEALVRLIIPVEKPLGSLTESFLDMVGSSGEALSSFSNWVKESPTIAKAYDSISSSIDKFMTWTKEMIGGIDDFASEIYNMEETQKILNDISEAFQSIGIFATPYIQKAVEKIKEFKNATLEFIPKAISDSAEWFTHKIKDLSDAMDKIDFSNPISWFEKFNGITDKIKNNDGLTTFIDNMKMFGKGLKEAFTFDNFSQTIETFKTTVGGFIDWIKENVSPLFDDVSIGGVVAGGAGIGIVYSLVKIAQSFNNLFNSFSGVGDILGEVKDAISAYQNDLNASAILKTAAAIGVLAGALVLLSFTDTNQLLKAALALSMVGSIFFIGISVLSKALNKGTEMSEVLNTFAKGLSKSMTNLSKAVKYKAIGSMFKDISDSLIKVAVAIVALGYVYTNHEEYVTNGAKIVGSIVFVMVAIIASMSFLGNKLSAGMRSFAKASIGIAALAIALSIVTSSLSKFLQITLPNDWENKFKIISKLLLELGALTIIIGLASRIAGQGKLKTGPIIATVLGIAALTWILVELFKINLPNDWEQKMDILKGIFISFGAFMLVLGVASRIAGGQIKATGSILAMCVFLATAVAALMVLAIIPGDRLLKGALALGGILLALGGALYGAGKIVKPDVYKSILAMCVAVGTITASLAVLSMIPWEKLAIASSVLGVVLLTLAENFKAIGKIKNNKAMGPIIAMIGEVLVITGALVILSQQPWESLLAAGIAMSATILSLTVLMKTLSKSTGLKPEKINQFLKASLAVIPIAAALGILAFQPWNSLLASGAAMSVTLLTFGETLRVLSSLTGLKPEKINQFLKASLATIPIGVALTIIATQDWQSILAAGVSLSAALISMSVAFRILNGVKVSGSIIAAVLVGMVGIAGIALSLTVLATQDWQSILAAGAAVSTVLLAMSAAMAICGIVGNIAPAALIGMALLDVFIVSFAAILYALGALCESESAKNMIGGGASILAMIGEGIGAFVGNIISGIGGGIGEALVKIGEGLSGFINAAKGFFDYISSLDDGVLSGIAILSAGILLLTGAAFVNGIMSFFGISAGFVIMGINLSAFAIAAMPFFQAIKNIDESSMNGVKSLAETILVLTAANVIEGLTSWFTGGLDLVGFGEELKKFGPAIKSYSDSVIGLDGGAVEASANAALILAKMATNLPKEGGFWQEFFGTTKSLSVFAKELDDFGPAIKSYSDSVIGLDGGAVEASANAAQILSDMAKTLPNSGGLAAQIFGDNTLSAFAKELDDFGPAIKSYADSVYGLKPESVEASVRAAQILSDMAKTLPNSGGLVSLFTGDNDLATFGEQLKKFGEAMSSYYTSVSGINATQLSSVVTEFSNLVNLANTVTEVDTTGMTGFVDALGEIGTTGVTSFITAFTDSYTTVTETINTFVTTASNALQLKTTVFTQKGTSAVTAYLNAIKLKYPEATTTGTTLANNVLTAITLLLPTFNVKGVAAGNQFLLGIKSKYPEATTTGTSLANNALAGCQGLYNSFYTAGANAGQGYVDGLKSKLSSVTAAAKAMANATLNSTKATLDENSPSKKMGQIGAYAGIGFVNKLMSYVSKAHEAGKSIANAALNGANQAINDISEVFTNDLSMDPVITPHVNMSEVTKSASDINRLFNQAISLTSKQAGMVSTNFAQRRNNNYDDEIQNDGNPQKPVIINNNDFTQNNYSPKALSRIDIYRQTNNQFSRFTEAVNNT